MSAGVGADFDDEQAQQVTDPYAQLGHNMYDKSKLEFHTQIEKPDPMTVIDTFAEYCEDEGTPGLAKLMKSSQKWKRTNMVAFKRERARETERMVKGANAEEQKKKKEMQELMVGMNR